MSELPGSWASIGYHVMQAYFVRGNDKRAQLYEVLDAFDIQVPYGWLPRADLFIALPLPSRCPCCSV